MRVIICGALGRMGVEVQKKIAENSEDVMVCGVDINADGVNPLVVRDLDDFTGEADVIIDFSHHTATEKLLAYAVRRQIPCVVCTTGHTPEEQEKIQEASASVAVFHSANMSIGIAILADFARRAAALLPHANIEIIEKHHNQKLDAPSGTALMLAKEMQEVRTNAELVCGRSGHGKRTDTEIGIHALRLGNVVGEHEVILDTGVETISLKHEAHSRSLFADGAVVAARFLCGKPAGLYDMKAITGKES